MPFCGKKRKKYISKQQQEQQNNTPKVGVDIQNFYNIFSKMHSFEQTILLDMQRNRNARLTLGEKDS